MRIIPPNYEPPRKVKRRSGRRQDEEPSELPTAASFYVPHLPGLSGESRLSLYAGNLPSTSESSQSDAHLYFLLAMNRHIPHRQRLLIWLNGGPGCSSFDGSMIEIGPVRVEEDGSLREVENTAWNEYANVLFLDQPAGTGYSYVTKHDDVRELGPAAEQVVNFLANLYKVFPEFINMDTYIAGESYAGQYIPYIADAILKTTLISTRLKGLMIGNGWISPREQYPAYLEYLVTKGFVKEGSTQHASIQKSVDKCTDEIAMMDQRQEGSKGMVLIPLCEEILGTIGAVLQQPGSTCLNMYDTTKYQQCGAEWPEELRRVTPYLRRNDVMEALHANTGPPKQWQHCSNVVGSHFWTPNSVPAGLLLPHLLEKIPILLFAGERDLMCAGIGIQRMIEKMEWAGEVGFGDAKPQDWTVDSKLAGTWTTARGLTYVEVYNASHMVPIDVPVAAHDMLLRFMQVDTLRAAGQAAKVPSQVGNEANTVLGATHPDGSTLKENEAAAEAANGGKSPASDMSEDGFDKAHERIYGPRRTAFLFFLLILLGFVVWGFLRWRTNRRRERYRKVKGKGREGGIRLDSDIRAAEEARGMGVTLPHQEEEPLETTAVFDVGEEDEFEDADDLENSEEIEAHGDLGRSENPWHRASKE
ncbi:alpha/beta-hydrolase [Meredithblackwellia eburnea MCA 4105]